MNSQKSNLPSPVTTPDGYMKDPHGRLVPIETIKPVDLKRDAVVRQIINDARELNAAIAAFRKRAFEAVEEFIAESAREYKVKMRGAEGKGNVSLATFDGQYKVQRAVSESISFDERLHAAKELVHQCINDWSDGARPEVQALITGAFEVDKAGNINTGRVLSLRKLDIDDKRWKRAMEAISDSVTVTGSKAYIRVYERDGEGNGYKPISLDVASA